MDRPNITYTKKTNLRNTVTHTVCVTVLQPGTPGRAIQQYGPRGGYVVLDDKRYNINARIHSISGYSAHADQTNLFNFIKRMRIKPQHVRLIHGESDAQETLRSKLEILNITVD